MKPPTLPKGNVLDSKINDKASHDCFRERAFVFWVIGDGCWWVVACIICGRPNSVPETASTWNARREKIVTTPLPLWEGVRGWVCLTYNSLPPESLLSL